MESSGIGRIVEIQQPFADDVEASGSGEGIAIDVVEALGSGNGIASDEDICSDPFLTSASQTWNPAMIDDLDEMHLGRSSKHRDADMRYDLAGGLPEPCTQSQLIG
jgi:hypothetical protein